MNDVNILMASVDASPKRGGIAQFAHHCTDLIQRQANKAVFVGPKTYIPSFDHCHEITDTASNEAIQSGHAYTVEMERLRAMFREIVAKHDINRILLFHPFYYGRPAVEIAQEFGIPCECVVHGTELTSQFPELVQEDAFLAPKAVTSRNFHLLYTLSKLDRIHANSRFTAEICGRIAGREDISICGCGISEQDYIQLQAQSVGTAVRSEGPPHLCFVGRLVRHKFVHRIFPLLAQTNAMLDIIGTGPEQDKLQEQARSEAVADRVVFHGDVEDDKKWRILTSSDFLLLPSDLDPKTNGYEGFGIVLLEAVAAGTIPVSSAQQGAADPIEEYGIGLKGLAPGQSLRETADLFASYASQTKYSAKIDEDRAVIRDGLLWEHVVHRISKDW